MKTFYRLKTIVAFPTPVEGDKTILFAGSVVAPKRLGEALQRLKAQGMVEVVLATGEALIFNEHDPSEVARARAVQGLPDPEDEAEAAPLTVNDSPVEPPVEPEAGEKKGEPEKAPKATASAGDVRG